MFFFPSRLTPSVPFTTRTIDSEMVLGDYVLPEGVSQLIYFMTIFDGLSCKPLIFQSENNSAERWGPASGEEFP